MVTVLYEELEVGPMVCGNCACMYKDDLYIQLQCTPPAPAAAPLPLYSKRVLLTDHRFIGVAGVLLRDVVDVPHPFVRTTRRRTLNDRPAVYLVPQRGLGQGPQRLAAAPWRLEEVVHVVGDLPPLSPALHPHPPPRPQSTPRRLKRMSGHLEGVQGHGSKILQHACCGCAGQRARLSGVFRSLRHGSSRTRGVASSSLSPAASSSWSLSLLCEAPLGAPLPGTTSALVTSFDVIVTVLLSFLK